MAASRPVVATRGPERARQRAEAAADFALRQFSWGRFRRLVDSVCADPGYPPGDVPRVPALAPRR